jgi:hypothetical protein
VQVVNHRAGKELTEAVASWNRRSKVRRLWTCATGTRHNARSPIQDFLDQRQGRPLISEEFDDFRRLAAAVRMTLDVLPNIDAVLWKAPATAMSGATPGFTQTIGGDKTRIHRLASGSAGSRPWTWGRSTTCGRGGDCRRLALRLSMTRDNGRNPVRWPGSVAAVAVELLGVPIPHTRTRLRVSCARVAAIVRGTDRCLWSARLVNNAPGWSASNASVSTPRELRLRGKARLLGR